MPYKSDAQRRYFNANRKELEAQGVDVGEWNDPSRGKKLPERAKKKKRKKSCQSPRAGERLLWKPLRVHCPENSRTDWDSGRLIGIDWDSRRVTIITADLTGITAD